MDEIERIRLPLDYGFYWGISIPLGILMSMPHYLLRNLDPANIFLPLFTAFTFIDFPLILLIYYSCKALKNGQIPWIIQQLFGSTATQNPARKAHWTFLTILLLELLTVLLLWFLIPPDIRLQALQPQFE